MKAGSKCYKAFNERRNWDYHMCEDKAEGSKFATITNAEENAAAWKAMKKDRGKQKEV